MYSVKFTDSDNDYIQAASTVIECKNFSTLLWQSPSDRHAYSLKFYSTPVRLDKHLK